MVLLAKIFRKSTVVVVLPFYLRIRFCGRFAAAGCFCWCAAAAVCYCFGVALVVTALQMLLLTSLCCCGAATTFAAANMHPPTGFFLPSALPSICLLVARCKTIPEPLSSTVGRCTSRTHRHVHLSLEGRKPSPTRNGKSLSSAVGFESTALASRRTAYSSSRVMASPEQSWSGVAHRTPKGHVSRSLSRA